MMHPADLKMALACFEAGFVAYGLYLIAYRDWGECERCGRITQLFNTECVGWEKWPGDRVSRRPVIDKIKACNECAIECANELDEQGLGHGETQT